MQKQIDKEVWEQTFQAVRPEHEQWIKFDEKLVVEDFLSEVEEWLSNPADFGKHPLGKTYREALTCWIIAHENNQAQGICDEATIQRVMNLLNVL